MKPQKTGNKKLDAVMAMGNIDDSLLQGTVVKDIFGNDVVLGEVIENFRNDFATPFLAGFVVYGSARASGASRSEAEAATTPVIEAFSA